MEYTQIEVAFNEIIETYKNEASQYSQYCPEELLYAFEHLYNAQIHALESLKHIFTSDKFYS